MTTLLLPPPKPDKVIIANIDDGPYLVRAAQPGKGLIWIEYRPREQPK